MVAIFCVIFIFIIGNDEIVVYEDRISQTSNDFFSLIFRSGGREYAIKNIKSAYLPSVPPSRPAEIGVALLLIAVLPKRKVVTNKGNPIYFELKSGEIIQVTTDLECSRIKKIVELINVLIQKNHTR